MTKLALMIGAAAATLLLAACADDEYAYGPAGYQTDAAYVGGAPYDVWYDGYYGPYGGGYWDSGFFYYRDTDGAFRRDSDGHFRHGRFGDAQGFRTNRF